jgi:arsenate reductase
MRHVLFVCNHNAGRSQMAHAFFEAVAPDDIVVSSAGTQPAKEVWPVVVQAMAEVGIDIAGRKPQKLTNEMQMQTDWAITMGCGDACPFVPSAVHAWDLQDPSTMEIEDVRKVRDEVQRLVLDLVDHHLDEIYADKTAHQMRLERLLRLLSDLEDHTPQEIRACADRILEEFSEGAVRSHVITLAHRRAKECLKAGGCAPVPTDDTIPVAA